MATKMFVGLKTDLEEEYRADPQTEKKLVDTLLAREALREQGIGLATCSALTQANLHAVFKEVIDSGLARHKAVRKKEDAACQIF